MFLLLNAVVSTCAILAVLWLWDPENRPAFLAPANAASPQTILGTTPGATISIPPQPTVVAEIPKGLIEIESVIGAGSAASEVVVLKRKGDGELQLSNWKLEDSNGNLYTFPGLTLYKDGAVYLHSAVGVNTVIDLYWNKGDSIWQSGETATLIDSLGTIQATYQIP